MARLFLMAIMSAIFVGPAAFANQRVELDFNDQIYRGSSSLMLKMELRRQHRIMADDYELISARLVAKTKAGRGTAKLQVGNWYSRPERVNMGDFNDRSPRSFDRVDFFNDSRSRNDNGPWQIDMNGNFQVRKVVLVLQRRGGGHGGGGGHDRVDRVQVRCESPARWLTVECQVQGRPVAVRLLNQLSNAPCVQGDSFGITRTGMYVAKGCRGIFVVETYR